MKKPHKIKEPEISRKERLRLSKTTTTQVIPNKKKNRKVKIDED